MSRAKHNNHLHHIFKFIAFFRNLFLLTRLFLVLSDFSTHFVLVLLIVPIKWSPFRKMYALYLKITYFFFTFFSLEEAFTFFSLEEVFTFFSSKKAFTLFYCKTIHAFFFVKRKRENNYALGNTLEIMHIAMRGL